MKFTITIILIFLLGLISLQAQTAEIDSLEKELLQPQSDTSRAIILSKLTWKLRSTDLKKALNYGTESLMLMEKLNYRKALAQTMNYVGVVYRNLGDLPNALSHYYKALKLGKENKQLTQIAYAYNNMGEIFHHQNHLIDAGKHVNKAIDIFEQIGHKRGQAYGYLKLGGILQEQKRYDEALKVLLKAKKIREAIVDKPLLDAILNRIGQLFITQKKYKEALKYLNEALKVNKKSKNMGSLYNIQNDLASIYIQQNQPDKAIQLANNTFRGATVAASKPLLKASLRLLCKAHELKKDYTKAYHYQRQFLKITEEFLKEQYNFRLNALESIHELAKKQSEINLKNKDIKLLQKEQKENKLRRSLVYALVGSIVLLLGLIFVLIRGNRAKNKANSLLQVKHQEIEEKNQAILIQNAELQWQQKEISSQRDAIKQQNGHIKQSIRAALAIQEAILPHKELAQKVLKDYFIIFRPRDIVSGDFYWVGEVDQQRIVAVIDCTGHGVQGAFMSMIGFTMLNEIINVKKITEPFQVLERLRLDIKQVLRQEDNENRSGMDVAIIRLEAIQGSKDTLLTFAGAKRPLWYIEKGSCQVKIIKGNKISIGLTYKHNRAITSTNIVCPKGTSVYLGTDGFADQNNVHRDKLGSYGMIKLLEESSHLSLLKQKQTMENALNKYMKGTEQRDDILLLGMQL